MWSLLIVTSSHDIIYHLQLKVVYILYSATASKPAQIYQTVVCNHWLSPTQPHLKPTTIPVTQPQLQLINQEQTDREIPVPCCSSLLRYLDSVALLASSWAILFFSAILLHRPLLLLPVSLSSISSSEIFSNTTPWGNAREKHCHLRGWL